MSLLACQRRPPKSAVICFRESAITVAFHADCHRERRRRVKVVLGLLELVDGDLDGTGGLTEAKQACFNLSAGLKSPHFDSDSHSSIILFSSSARLNITKWLVLFGITSHQYFLYLLSHSNL